MSGTLSKPSDRDRLVGLLARADRNRIVALADDVIDNLAVSAMDAPVLGTVLMQVREPIEKRRFYLGDLLATQATVTVDGHEGWAMRLGDDGEATVAAAICDAAMQFDNPHRDRVLELCDDTLRSLSQVRADENARVARTAITFEELGG